MKNRSNKLVLLIAPALLALVAVVVLYALLYQQIGASADRARSALDIVKAEQSLQAQSKSLQTEYQSTADARSRLPGLFVPAGDAVAFIESLESIGPAASSTVAISTISADPLDGAAPGTTGAISAVVSASGTWTAAMRTLVLAESLPYESVIDRVSLSGNRASVNASAKGVWHITFRVRAMLLAGAPTNP